MPRPASSSEPLSSAVPSDPLSDIIDTLRLSARVQGAFELAVPFALQVDAHAEIDVRLITLLRGSAAVSTGGGSPVTLSAGDFLLQSRSSTLEIRDAVGSRAKMKRPADFPRTVPHRGSGPGPFTTLVGVGFSMSPQAKAALLSQLPSMLVASSDASPALATAAALFRAEASSPRGGSRALLSRLGEVIFVDFLRREGEREGGAPGDLKALADPALSRALALVHADPSVDWTIELLGRAAGLSRSAFAARFHAKMGEPPLQYVARWRMMRAARLLRESNAGIGDIASQVGYRSEASFSRAFARFIGSTPGVFRRTERR